VILTCFGILLMLYFMRYLWKDMRFVAFLATEYHDVLSGYQPGQMVER